MKSIQNLCLILTLVFLIASCGSRESKSGEQVGIVSSKDSVSEFQRKITLGMSEIPSWKSHWAAILGEFDGNDFEWVFTDSIDPMEMPEKNPVPKTNPLYPYQIAHPGGDGTVDLYSYNNFVRYRCYCGRKLK
jgi:hypothetical protein